MRYANGKPVLLGDLVELYDGCEGVVVCDVDGDAYDEAYPREEWQEILSRGILVQSGRAGLVHLAEPNEDLQLIRRRG
jgi:hypothetical protein